MNNFYLIRHAEAIWSEDENRPLSGRGRRDAERVADNLIGFPIDLIISSPYRRAKETIVPLAKRLNLIIQIEPNLRERCLSSEAIEDFYSAVEQAWADPTFAHPGGESNLKVQKRGLIVISRLQEEISTKHIVLSTHGNLLAVLLQHFDPSIDINFWRSLTFPDIYQLGISSNGEIRILRLWE
ncbi:MAG: histidine phosphatase family protein [Chloroflexota bacterium]|nr:MAG: histidine phosphatase family protein [Chloroflexota bacterium]